MNSIKVITFDVFGTLLSYENCPWIHKYSRCVQNVRAGTSPYKPLSEIFKIIGADWTKLKVRPGVVEGLQSLNKKYVTCSLSNADHLLAYDIGEYFKLPWRMYINTEDAKTFKPHPRFYCNALRNFVGTEGGGPANYDDEILHVASHQFDLEGAQQMGFKTALLNWPGYIKEPIQNKWDFVVGSMEELVQCLT